MALYIGRAGVDLAGAIEMSDYAFSGDQVDIAGDIHWSTLAGALAVRQQLLGHVDNPDEPVIPIRHSDDARLDGYYRVLGIDVDSVPMSLNTNVLNWSGTFQRIGSYGAPEIEERLIQALRSNGHSLTGTSSYGEYWPTTAMEPVVDDANALVDIGANRTGDNSLTFDALGFNEIATVGAQNRVFRVQIPPASYYSGAPRLEYDIGSGVYVPLVGQQIPRGYEESWRLTTDVCRWSMNSSGHIVGEYYDTNTWQQVGIWYLYSSSAKTVLGVTVLENSPTQVRLRFRLSVDGSTGVNNAYYVDMKVQRGWQRVEITTFIGPNYLATHVLRSTTTVACTDGTYYINRTASDGNGNRWAIGASQPLTRDTTNGGITLTSSAAVANYWIHLYDGGAAAPTNPSSANACYYAATSLQRRVTSR